MAITVPDVLPQPVQASREQVAASVETFGGGQGLEAAGQEEQKLAANVGEIASLETLRANQTAAQEASAKLAAEHTRILYDPQTGVMASQGTDALKAQEDGWNEFRQKANEIAGTLHGEAQLGAFNKYAVAMGDAFHQQAMQHVDQQLKIHDAKTYDALVQNTTDSAAMSYGNPHVRQLALDKITDSTSQYGRRNGWNPEEIQEQQSKLVSNFHDQVIARMLADKQDLMAQKYFDENKDQITDSQIRDKVQNQLKEGSYRGESMRQADSIWDKTGGNLQEAFSLARKIDDPEVQDRTITRLRERDAQVKEAHTSDQDNAFFDAQKLVSDAYKKGVIKGDASLSDVVPPDTWTRMSASQQEATRRLYNGGNENNDATWVRWNLMSPEDKAAVTPANFQSDILADLDPKHRDMAMKMYNDARGNKNDAISDHDQAKLIESTAQETGIIPGLKPGRPASKLKGDAASKYTAFQNTIQDAVSDFERTQLGGRRRASRDETQKIVDQQTLKLMGDKSPSFFSIAGQLTGLSAKPATSFEDIPDGAKEDLLAIARHLGKTVTKEQMEKAFVGYQAKDPKAINAVFQ